MKPRKTEQKPREPTVLDRLFKPVNDIVSHYEQNTADAIQKVYNESL
jgi:hypothetical protein